MCFSNTFILNYYILPLFVETKAGDHLLEKMFKLSLANAFCNFFKPWQDYINSQTTCIRLYRTHTHKKQTTTTKTKQTKKEKKTHTQRKPTDNILSEKTVWGSFSECVSSCTSYCFISTAHYQKFGTSYNMNFKWRILSTFWSIFINS